MSDSTWSSSLPRAEYEQTIGQKISDTNWEVLVEQLDDAVVQIIAEFNFDEFGEEYPEE